MEEQKFSGLKKFLLKIPPMQPAIGSGTFEDGLWWIKFSLDIEHPLAWHGVQEIAHVVNYLSLDQRLPTVFYPVSPPPYMNGGPNNFLSWVIESKDISFTPDDLKEWLEGRLPNPVDDLNSWLTDDELE
jgi:hypothetical protein